MLQHFHLPRLSLYRFHRPDVELLCFSKTYYHHYLYEAKLHHENIFKPRQYGHISPITEPIGTLPTSHRLP